MNAISTRCGKPIRVSPHLRWRVAVCLLPGRATCFIDDL